MISEERPDGIIITLSNKMFKEKGYRNWLTNFLNAMSQEEWTYWFRTSVQPKQEVLFLYICAGNKIRFRCNLVMTEGPSIKTFESHTFDNEPTPGNEIKGRAWLVCAGPVVRAPRPMIEMKGFRGFRYTQKLF